ncbi:MAG: hypothetical protein XE12_1453 [Synergistales bacterium 54_9]|nr:MAG: hypothetical protein XE12_1453 [Synergistales bacterium 54_9]
MGPAERGFLNPDPLNLIRVMPAEGVISRYSPFPLLSRMARRRRVFSCSVSFRPKLAAEPVVQGIIQKRPVILLLDRRRDLSSRPHRLKNDEILGQVFSWKGRHTQGYTCGPYGRPGGASFRVFHPRGPDTLFPLPACSKRRRWGLARSMVGRRSRVCVQLHKKHAGNGDAFRVSRQHSRCVGRRLCLEGFQKGLGRPRGTDRNGLRRGMAFGGNNRPFDRLYGGFRHSHASFHGKQRSRRPAWVGGACRPQKGRNQKSG